MEASTIVLTFTILATLGVIAKQLREWWQRRPTFTYKGVKVWFIDTHTDKREQKAIVVEQYERLEDPSLYAEFAYKKPKATKELKAALKRGIDAIEPRLGWRPEDEGLSLRIQAWPIAHYATSVGWFRAYGQYITAKRLGYISVMPEERGGLKATASLVVHEIGGHHHKRHKEHDVESDWEHTDKEFWALMDSQEGL